MNLKELGVLQAMKNLLHTAVLQNLAANALKSFGTFTDTSTELAMCLLDFRKLFTTDQSKVQPIQNRIIGLLLEQLYLEFKMMLSPVHSLLMMPN